MLHKMDGVILWSFLAVYRILFNTIDWVFSDFSCFEEGCYRVLAGILKICFKDKETSLMFRIAWRWVQTDEMFFFIVGGGELILLRQRVWKRKLWLQLHLLSTRGSPGNLFEVNPGHWLKSKPDHILYLRGTRVGIASFELVYAPSNITNQDFSVILAFAKYWLISCLRLDQTQMG